MRTSFEIGLREMNDSLVKMGEMVNNAISNAMEALLTKDVKLAKMVIVGDAEINDLERKIENQCLKLFMKQQPVASDLRLVSSALKMVTDLERIGDQAADISELVLGLIEDNRQYTPDDLGSIVAMSELAKDMVGKSIEAFVNYDLDIAYRVISMDDKVDAYYEKVKEEVVQDIKNEEHSPNALVDFILIAKYLERIGDHAQNIGEWVVYSITGEMKKED